VLTAIQAAILDTTLPAIEYTGKAILTEEDGIEDIPLQFDINKVMLIRDKKAKTSRKALELKNFLVYTPFLLYTSSFQSDSVSFCFPKISSCLDLC
jgi:hypothetical protein